MELRSSRVMLVFLMCYIFGHIITSHKNDIVEAKSFSQFEDLEINEQLKTINKPAVKIIKSIDGELYGCVDFFKQPAFDHPSMKNHSYHYKMRRIRNPGVRERKTNNTENKFGYLWENGVGCPIGTVPIQRVTKEDLFTLNSFDDDSYQPRGSWNTTTYDPNNIVHYDQHHYAVGRTKNIGKRYNGATMDLCLTAPQVKPTQYSAARLHIQMGNDFIQTGFTVNPVLYKDHLPRTFVYTNAGGKSCYNTHCDVGIVMVRQDFPLGMTMTPISVPGAKTSHYAIMGLIKDQENGNWWLEFGGDANEVGFWPSSRFRQSFGNKVEWGGEVYSASLPGPQMGFGDFPVMNIIWDAYIKRLTTLDGNYRVDRVVEELEEFSDDTRGYGVMGLRDSKDPDTAHMIFYGGPGNI